jgi:uncharacterized repeat protein (TIGR01451 family)
MKRYLQFLFLFATLTACSYTEPSGPSNDAPEAVASARQPGPPPGPKPGPPPAAGQPAELTIVKTAVSQDATIQAGDPVAFDIRVTNSGKGTALDVHLTDNLPMLGSTWNIIESAGEPVACMFIGQTTSLFCGSHPASPTEPALPQIDLDPGEFFSVRVSSPTDESDCGTVTNTASASADNAPGVTDSASIVIVCPPPEPSAELTIVKTAVSQDATIQAGDPVAFDIRVTNSGTATALDVHLTDNLPMLGSTWNIIDSAGEPVACMFIGQTTSLFCGSHPASPTEPALPQIDLDPGEFFSVRVSSPTDESDCGTVTNTASASADNAPGGTDSASTVIVCPPM